MHRISSLVGSLVFLSIAGVPSSAAGQTYETVGLHPAVAPAFEGRVELDRAVYTSGDSARITATAPARDTDRGAAETVLVTVATRGAILHDFPLRETGPDTGVFAGEVDLTELVPAQNDSISVAFQVSDTETALASSLIRSGAERFALETP